ncbi:hypothetical protein B0T17DRAFT_523226 [Bombardia bombarda]|uniref:Uncharacterized protein n=1 Tax=Bombardia bombarda TaxID=252184 RepID=A0AA40C8Y6_9PEZI|nr:hypothetical protein B0T17DRAFT_523226 [Bombardia bombarda]
MLLTSSQVSIALSSGIICIFTTALFLSGYAIQQRTLRDLRQAIKPSPRPDTQIFLPDRFKKSTTELKDGTVVIVPDDADDKYGGGGIGGMQRQREQQNTVIEIRPTLPQETINKEGGGSRRPKPSKPKPRRTRQRQQQQQQQQQIVTNSQEKIPEAPVPAKDDAKTEEEKRASEKEQTPEKTIPKLDLVEHPEDPQKPVSRAERRRLIKEEIQRLASTQERGYYQRRLW